MAVEPLLTIGIPYFDDWARCHVAIQALRADNDLSDCELIVVDNNPSSEQGKLMAGWIPQLGRYIPYTDRIGTAPCKNAVFANARGRFVLCMDSHVLLPAKDGTLERFKGWLREHLDCDDIISGPIVWDDLGGGATEFHPVWRGEMWGIWAGDTRQNPPEEREIWGTGMGCFCARRESWLGFHKDFWGFGGEEGYIAEKYRKAGRKFWHIPWFKWWHSFARFGGIPFVNDDYHKCRNYVIGFQELGLDIAPIREHFVNEPPPAGDVQVAMAGASVSRTEGARRISPALWDYLLKDPVANREPPQEKSGGCASCGGKKISQDMTLDRLYIAASSTPSVCNEHCGKLKELASKCETVVDCGDMLAVTTVALLAGQPKKLVIVRNTKTSFVDGLKERRGDTDVVFTSGSATTIDPVEADLLFLDDEPHSADRVYAVLERHAAKVKRFVFHDTQIFGESFNNKPGILPALRRWMKEHPEWSVVYDSLANHGLTVASREVDDKPKLPSLVRQAWNLSKAMATHVANGLKSSSEEIAQSRLDVCTTCEHRNGDRCSRCGCFLAAKSSLETSECPIGKWKE